MPTNHFWRDFYACCIDLDVVSKLEEGVISSHVPNAFIVLVVNTSVTPNVVTPVLTLTYLDTLFVYIT